MTNGDFASFTLTPAVHEAVQLAEREVGTGQSVEVEHILLGLALIEGTLAANVLRGLGVTEADIRSATSKARSSRRPGEADSIFRLATEAAKDEGLEAFDTEHLLLAMSTDQGNAGYDILHGLGVEAPDIRRQINELRGATS
jgi:ATP-dependent Clp protease ATP-binding subunit ClpA